MTQPTGQPVVMKDFTKRRDAIQFKIDDDVFVVRPSIPVDGLQRVMTTLRSAAEGTDEPRLEDLMPRFKEAIKLLLMDESGRRFVERMGDWNNPIDLEQVQGVVEWITAQLAAGRPTPPSPDSTSGSPSDGAGTSSTDGASFAESIPSN